jgi:large subunit ribosomal protein L31
MKKDIHPDNYREVIFKDTSSGEEFLIGSTVQTEKTGEFKGKKYSLKEIEISSASHPFYTGKDTVVDTAGRVEKFKARRAAAKGEAKSKAVKKSEKKTKREKTKK